MDSRPLFHSKEIIALVGVFFSAILLSLLWSTFSAPAAYAVCANPPLLGEICTDDKDDASGGAGELSNEPDYSTKPRSYTKYVAVDPNNRNFAVGCTSWDGSGAWKTSSNCSVTDGNVNVAAGGMVSNGTITFLNNSNGGGGATSTNSNPTTFYDSDKSCAPVGAKSPYAQTWNITITQTYKKTYDYTWSRADKIWYVNSPTQSLTGEYVVYTKVGCTLPVEDKVYTKCFWNYGGNAYYSIDRTRTASGWEDFGARPAQSSDPSTPFGGSGGTAPTCAQTGSVDIDYPKDVDKLGYYKNYVSYNYRTYTNVRWLTAAGAVLNNQWSTGSTLNGSATTWWAYSCSAGLPNATEGAYYSQGALPDRDSSLNPANCPQSVWECQLASPQTVGLDLTSIAAGTTNPNTPVTVMRNGEKIPVAFAKVRVVDRTNNSNTDVTNGAVGGGVKDITNIEYKAEVKMGSTPFYGTNPNDSKQYFKLFRNATSDSTDKWGTWYGNANANINKTLAFVWASEGSKPFVAERNYRVTGSFLVPQGGAINSGSSAGAPQGSEWKVGTYDCLDYDYSSGTRVSNGPLTAYSNNVNVVRSVTDAG